MCGVCTGRPWNKTTREENRLHHVSACSAQCTLNLDTCEALQAAGLTGRRPGPSPQPLDLEPLRVEMNHLRMELRSEMDRHFAGLELAAQRADLSHHGHIGGILVATNLPA